MSAVSTATVTSVCAALAAALPVPSPLGLSDAVPLGPGFSPFALQLPADPGTAVTARLTRPGGLPAGELVVVVAADLVEALRDSPLGPLDVAAAIQPALDAAAAATGSTAERGAELPVDVALDGPLSRAGTMAVALLDETGTVVSTVVVCLEPAATTGSTAAAPVASTPRMARSRGLELLRGVEMEVTVELGRTRMTVRDLLSLAPGAVVELDRAAGSPADLMVNGTLIARGEVVVVDEDFGIRITEIVTVASGEDDADLAATSGAA